MNLRKAITIGFPVVCFSGNAGAAEIEGVRFLDTLTVGDTQIRLNGTGLLRYRISRSRACQESARSCRATVVALG